MDPFPLQPLYFHRAEWRIATTKAGALRVTLDTNICNLIGDPVQYAKRASPGTGERLRAAIAGGRIRGFVSEASVFVECLGFPEKLAYLAVAGTPDPRPAVDRRRLAVFEALSRLGVQMLHAPLIGAEIFIESMPWADDELFSPAERQERFGDFISQYPRHEPLEKLGMDRLRNQPPVPPDRAWSTPDGVRHYEMRQKWALALKRDWDCGDEAARKTLRKQAEPLIGEWCDVLIVGSHVAYGNDVFCTTDCGRNAGKNSLLHHTNRAVLAQKGIKIVSPDALRSQLAS